MSKRRSPMDLRDGLEREILEPYEPPRMLTRQAKVDQMNYDPKQIQEEDSLQPLDDVSRQSWMARLANNKSHRDLRHSLSKRIARLSSLESNRSSSSMELDASDNRQHQLLQRTMPLISITSNDTAIATGDESESTQQTNGESGAGRRRRELYQQNYYGRPKMSDDFVEDDDEDDDAFEDATMPMPYSSNSQRLVRGLQAHNRQLAAPYPTTLRQYEELLDDRQGMNNSEQQFTKAEKAQRASLDGSIISDLRGDSKKMAGGGVKGSHKKDKRRSKSPSSSSMGARRRGHSRRGFLGLASRLKLTKKHESIAKLQLYILNSGLISLKTLDRDLQSFLPRERLSVKEFQERVRLMRKYDVLSTIEYRFASKYETYVCKHAQQETNQPKNNYKKCIPYDYNRVVLKTLPNVADSDYINASHVDSCLKPNAYIAAQGPNENTIEDFWRMIWEQKTFVIVMLTKVFDFIRVMCNQYWPVELNKPERYGSIEVTLLYEEPLADFVIRTIKISKLKGNQQSSAKSADDSQAGGDQTASTTMGDAPTSGGVDGTRPTGELLGDSDSEDEYSDETDISDEMPILNEPQRSHSQLNLAVRAPKFLAARAKRRRGSREERSPPVIASSIRDDASVAPDLSPPPTIQHQRSASEPRDLSSQADETQQTTRAKKREPPNEFLHPLFNSAHLATSLNSLSSEPNSPVTPRTPSSAGLDRSSATRRAVKKKRRERVKNQRPKRTQFMVPTESQLLDDDDDEQQLDDEGNGETTNGKTNDRIIYQFHYNSWASHTCPFISSLLHFRRRVRICMDEMSKSGRTGPAVVHCNDGCGRTGTYLCIDSNLELAEEDNVLDIYNYTRKMRQSRKFLIENLEQYKFVYDTIEEAIYCGKTWFPVADLHKRLKHKSQRNPLTRKNEYLLEYEKICRMTSKFSIGDCAGGHRVENREKNRDVSTVPPDNFRPYLTSFQTNDSTDFINAVFVDGYTRSKEYIVTEWPLHRTISDFWSLVYDHDCNSVILLANPGESSTYPSFLPSEKELRRRFGPVFSAEMVSYTHYQNIKSWIYTINKKIVSLTEVIAGVKSETKTTQVFQITCWPQGHRVPTSTNALVELMNMVERWRQRTTYGPVCVVSLNGKSRAGVYCAANVAIEQVVQHSEVDVFNAVKTVRRHRPQLIENMTEYKYCYDLILHYVLHYVNRSSDS